MPSATSHCQHQPTHSFLQSRYALPFSQPSLFEVFDLHRSSESIHCRPAATKATTEPLTQNNPCTWPSLPHSYSDIGCFAPQPLGMGRSIRFWTCCARQELVSDRPAEGRSVAVEVAVGEGVAGSPVKLISRVLVPNLVLLLIGLLIWLGRHRRGRKYLNSGTVLILCAIAR